MKRKLNSLKSSRLLIDPFWVLQQYYCFFSTINALSIPIPEPTIVVFTWSSVLLFFVFESRSNSNCPSIRCNIHPPMHSFIINSFCLQYLFKLWSSSWAYKIFNFIRKIIYGLWIRNSDCTCFWKVTIPITFLNFWKFFKALSWSWTLTWIIWLDWTNCLIFLAS